MKLPWFLVTPGYNQLQLVTSGNMWSHLVTCDHNWQHQSHETAKSLPIAMSSRKSSWQISWPQQKINDSNISQKSAKPNVIGLFVLSVCLSVRLTDWLTAYFPRPLSASYDVSWTLYFIENPFLLASSFLFHYFVYFLSCHVVQISSICMPPYEDLIHNSIIM